MGKKSKQKKVKKITEVESQTGSKGHSQYFYWVILILVVLFTGFIRLRLLSIPLERDEGEFAYMGQLILQGIPPYLISYNMKLPGIYAAYGLIMFVFGQTVEGIHLGFLLINGATTILIFLLVKRLYDSYTAIIASASFAILSVSPTVLGTSAHASHFVLLPAVAGILLMLKGIDSNKLNHVFWSGILLGPSFTMKQSGLFFVIFAFLYFLLHRLRLQRVPFRLFVKEGSLFLLGAILPFVLTCVILCTAGVFEKFWFWTFLYAFEYGSQVSFPMGIEMFSIQSANVIGRLYLFWGIAGGGIVALFWNKTARTQATFAIGFVVFSFLAVCPGFYFRSHYFVFLLPAVALLIGIAFSSLKRLIQRIQPKFQLVLTIFFFMAFLWGVFGYGRFFFLLSPTQACRFMYGLNPFPESIEIAKYIKAHTKKGIELR
jgi:4-amino-4-deoxy-L-arabinose transferase-like glycosyltransferase